MESSTGLPGVIFAALLVSLALPISVPIAAEPAAPDLPLREIGSESQPPSSRFRKISEDAVLQVSTGLEWTTHDSGTELEWPAAELHCAQRASLGGPWRLPSIEELISLFERDALVSCGESTCHVAAPIALTGAYYWSGSTPTAERRFYIDFRFGSRLAPRLRPTLTRRVLCVRAAHTQDAADHENR